MGFFSWQTCDTEQSIPAEAAEHPRSGETVYLLQPNGEAPIAGVYDGYGHLRDTDIYEWVARMNAHKWFGDPSQFSEAQLRDIGLTLSVEQYCLDTETGERWIKTGHTTPETEGVHTYLRGDLMIDEVGDSPGELVRKGRWKKYPIAEEIPYPIKLSYNPDARYEDWPASKNCPYQGFFFPEPDLEPTIPIMIEVSMPTDDGYTRTRKRIDAELVPDLVIMGPDEAPRYGVVVSPASIPVASERLRDLMADEIANLINESSSGAGLNFYTRREVSQDDPPLGGDVEAMDAQEAREVSVYIAWTVRGSREQHEYLELPWPPFEVQGVSADEQEVIETLRPMMMDSDGPDTQTGVIEKTGRHWSADYPVLAAQVKTWHTIDPEAPDEEPPAPR